MRWWDYRCSNRATYKPGACDVVLFRVNEHGDISVRCRSCKQIVVFTREEQEQYRVAELVST